ncbi:MAG: family 43 glycosylhydrolase, partial [Thermoleophilia bacterium]|nr:family 43 glycosylhydrolase [Thermoleophilia bacterium]
RRGADFWADRCYWAPECHPYRGAYYLFASLGSKDGHVGVQVLAAGAPLGPFSLHSAGPVTPLDQDYLDGTLYVDRSGSPHLVFSRSFRQAAEGEMCAVELSRDLRTATGDIYVLFRAVDAPWARPFPFAKDFGIGGDVFLSDGPFVYRTRSGQLLLLWSSFGPSGYAVGLARSVTGGIPGPWVHEPEPLFAGDGGHGMVFASKEGRLLLAVHAPNQSPRERPLLVELVEENDRLTVRRTPQQRTRRSRLTTRER